MGRQMGDGRWKKEDVRTKASSPTLLPGRRVVRKTYGNISAFELIFPSGDILLRSRKRKKNDLTFIYAALTLKV